MQKFSFTQKSFMKKFLLFFVFFVFLTTFLFSQNEKPEISTAKYFDVSKSLREYKSVPKKNRKEVENEKFVKKPRKKDIPEIDAVRQNSMGNRKMRSPMRNFDGIANANNSGGGVVPPDTNGDVGPNHYVQSVNGMIQVFDKQGNTIFGPVTNATIWSGFSGPWSTTNDGDPIILYDEEADRWLVSQFSVNTPNGTQWELMAISQTPDPTGAYYRYAFQFPYMPDYPKFGIWRDAFFMSCNMFHNNAFVGAGAAAMEREQMILGNPNARMVFFQTPNLPNGNDCYSMLPADCDGIFSPINSPNFFVYFNDDTYGNNDELVIWNFSVNWTNPSLSTFSKTARLNVESFDSRFGNSGDAISQKNTTKKLCSLSDRLMHRVQYRNFGSYQTLVLNHTVDVGTNHAGIRWYELRKTDAEWKIYQQGTFAPDNLNRWMGSIAMNGDGSIALGYSVSGNTLFPSIRYTGRTENDSLGQMTFAEEVICNGNASQTAESRWGDYSMMSVDPTDDRTFWYTQEYVDNVTSWCPWKTKIASFNIGDVNAPSGFAATTLTFNSIKLNWFNNSSSDSVLIATNFSNVFGTPVRNYQISDTLNGGGTVIFLGKADSFFHTSLLPNTQYFYKIWAKTGNLTYSSGITTSATTFELPKPLIISQNIGEINYSSAEINAVINPNNLPTTCKIEYGIMLPYSFLIPMLPDTLTGNQNISVSAKIPNLTPNTAYHCRILAANEAGTTNSSNLTFRTLSLPQISFLVKNTDSLPLRNVKIVLKNDTLFTDSLGKATFLNVFPADSVDFSISKTLFKTIFGKINIPDSSVTFNFVLLPQTFQVTFLVKDSLNQAVSDAKISFNYQISHTNLSGISIFENILPTQNLIFEISKIGFISQKDSLNLDSTNISKEIVLRKEKYRLTFAIIDSLSQVIENAKVTLQKYGEKLSDSLGKVNFENIFSFEKLNFQVSATDFSTFNDSISVTNTNISRKIVLKRNFFHVDSVRIFPRDSSFENSITLFARIFPQNATNKRVFWNISNDFARILEQNDSSARISVTSINSHSKNVYVSAKTEDGNKTDSLYLRIFVSNIEKLEKFGISVQPNPAKESFFVKNISNKKFKTFELTMFDNLGKAKLRKTLLNSESNEIRVSGFAKGVYLLQFNLDNQVVTTKIVIE